MKKNYLFTLLLTLATSYTIQTHAMARAANAHTARRAARLFQIFSRSVSSASAACDHKHTPDFPDEHPQSCVGPIDDTQYLRNLLNNPVIYNLFEVVYAAEVLNGNQAAKELLPHNEASLQYHADSFYANIEEIVHKICGYRTDINTLRELHHNMRATEYGAATADSKVDQYRDRTRKESQNK